MSVGVIEEDWAQSRMKDSVLDVGEGLKRVRDENRERDSSRDWKSHIEWNGWDKSGTGW
jgi:hypothetical protein